MLNILEILDKKTDIKLESFYESNLKDNYFNQGFYNF
jgi:hypothetical protein